MTTPEKSLLMIIFITGLIVFLMTVLGIAVAWGESYRKQK